jgi:hypothetical protein
MTGSPQHEIIAVSELDTRRSPFPQREIEVHFLGLTARFGLSARQRRHRPERAGPGELRAVTPIRFLPDQTPTPEAG